MDAKLVHAPTNLEAILRNAASSHGAGRHGEAEQGYRQILMHDPNHAEALHLLGVLLCQSGNSPAGIPMIQKAIEIKPKFPEALFNLGLTLQQAGQTYKASVAYTRAVRLEPSRDVAWHNMSQCFAALGDPDIAIDALEEGIAANPKSESLYDYACQLFKRSNNMPACLDMASRGIKHLPNAARLWIHRSHACFALGQLEEAWSAFTWRYRTPENPNIAPSYPIPQWQGEDLKEKSILIWTEQGPGETFLFSTMLDEIINASKKCIVITTERLQPILARSFRKAEVLDGTKYEVTPETADLQSSLVDLGQTLRKSWDDFPMLAPHIKPDPKSVEAAAKHYSREENEGLLVGISWRSFNVMTADNKSLPLSGWRSILTVPGIKFVSLQYGDVSSEVEHAQKNIGVKIQTEPYIDPVNDLDEHLAQVANMDLVITTSNTTAHEAAAQGIPTWVLTPHTIGEGLRWSWFTDRRDSPWYKSLTLYRQRHHGDWRMPIAEIAADLTMMSEKRVAHLDGSKHLLKLALAYDHAKQADAAMVAADAAIKNGLKSVDAHRVSMRGHLHAGDFTKASDVIDDALKLEDNSVALLVDRASTRKKLGRLDDAIEDLEHALRIDPHGIRTLNNFAHARRANGQLESGLELIRKAHDASPGNIDIKLSMGTFLLELGQIGEAKSLYDELLNNNDHVVEAASTLAIGMLLEGNFEDGWPLLKYRLGRPSANITYTHFPFPQWDGADISGQHILTWTEQGIGEEILLATMLDELANKARALTVLCSKRMVPIFKRSLKDVRVAERKLPLPSEAIDPDIDIQMSLGDVGQLLRPTFESFKKPGNKPALKAAIQTTKKLARKYRRSTPNPFLIGLAWNSGVPELGALKSLDLVAAQKLIANTDGTFVSLQYAPKPEHLAALSESGGENWIHDQSIDPLIDMDLATAQVAAMNYVVTISNTTAHIAGALGIPTALLVPRHTARLWYWFRDQTPCPWYPSVQVYESDKDGKWDEALADISKHIQILANAA